MAESYTESFAGLLYEALIHHADKHPKRELRIKAMEELIESGDLGSPLWLRSVLYKMKCDELAKPGKWPRMIGDLGVAASLQGFRSTGFIKEAMNVKPLIVNGFEIEFVKAPSYARLVSVFEKLMCPPEKNGYMALFSDDSCCSVRLPNGDVKYGNLDISGCDASHTLAIFDQIQYITPDNMKPDMSKLVKQCQLPIKIVNIHDRHQVCKLKNIHGEPVLYSGSTLTTGINNLANFDIGIAISEDLGAGRIKDFEDLATSASRVGYVITCEEAKIPHELQFLKHSPAWDENGVMRPLLNLGVLIRASGTSKGDLPGKKSEGIEARAASFQKSVLRGMYPGATFSILLSLRKHVQSATVTKEYEAAAAKHLPYGLDSESCSYHINDDELSRRYGLSLAEVQELAELIDDAGFGFQIQSSAVDKILRVDYGLQSPV
jgi:hypothetical protein